MLVLGFEIPFQGFAAFLLFVLLYSVPVFIMHGWHADKLLKFTGVPIVPGARMFIGHICQALCAKHFGIYDAEQIKKYGGIFGICEFTTPVLVVSDTKLIKQVLITRFSSFTDRRTLPLRGLMKLSMFDQKGDQWKHLRALATPFFTTAKLKRSFVLMQKATKTLIQNLNSLCEKGEHINAEGVSAAFTMDVIFATAFGLQIDSQSNKDDPFLVSLHKLINVSLDSPKLFITFMFPFVSRWFEFFGVTMFPSGYLDFFEKTVKRMITERVDHAKQNAKFDFICSLLTANIDKEFNKAANSASNRPEQYTTKRALTDDEIVAQALLFVLTGFDTVSQTLGFLLYNLAVHPGVQDKVVDELKSVILSEGSLTFESMSKLKYLGQCLDESMRLYPSIFRFDREACEDVILNESDDANAVKVPKGTVVVIPVWALHHDPNIWHDPETFNPDRFSEEQGAERDPFVHLPFGMGNRKCIGSHFAEVEIKLVVAEILRSFRLVTNSQTEIPVELQSGVFIRAKNGLWLSLEQRPE